MHVGDSEKEKESHGGDQGTSFRGFYLDRNT